MHFSDSQLPMFRCFVRFVRSLLTTMPIAAIRRETDQHKTSHGRTGGEEGPKRRKEGMHRRIAYCNKPWSIIAQQRDVDIVGEWYSRKSQAFMLLLVLGRWYMHLYKRWFVTVASPAMTTTTVLLLRLLLLRLFLRVSSGVAKSLNAVGLDLSWSAPTTTQLTIWTRVLIYANSRYWGPFFPHSTELSRVWYSESTVTI